MPQTDIVVLTDERYTHLNDDDWYHAQIATEEGLLIDALRALDLQVERRAWSDASMDWRNARAAVFRSTWDYVERIDEFRAWLDRVSAHLPLFNDAALIRWNLDKHYLADLAERGVDIVPTVFLEKATSTTLAQWLDRQQWDEVVVKPAISSGARLTWRATRADAERHQRTLARCLANEAMLIQAFQSAIATEGELSLIVIDGRVTHAVRKTAQAGDFRVQDDHGGRVHPHTPSQAEIAFAHAAVRACPQPPLYARVDMARSDQGLRLMEIELIEPELFLRLYPPAARLLARALATRLRTPTQ